MLTLLKCPLITENKHLLRDPELSIVTRNCQIYVMPMYTLKIVIYKFKDFMNCIKVKRNNLLNSIYNSVSQDFRFKETPYLYFFTYPELSSSLYSSFVTTSAIFQSLAWNDVTRNHALNESKTEIKNQLAQ